jgi:hypothetical protein
LEAGRPREAQGARRKEKQEFFPKSAYHEIAKPQISAFRIKPSIF